MLASRLAVQKVGESTSVHVPVVQDWSHGVSVQLLVTGFEPLQQVLRQRSATANCTRIPAAVVVFSVSVPPRLLVP
jgi:hypothetical protein